MNSDSGSGPKNPDAGWDDVAATLPVDKATIPAKSGRTAGPSITGGVRTTVLPRVKPDEGKIVIDHSTLQRYEEQKVLGTGGMGEVVAAVDNDIGRPVAIKRLLPELQGEEPLVRFAAEIQTIGSLEHPNIVPVHDVGIDENGRHYFVMKYVRGETIESIIERLKRGDKEAHARFTFEERTRIFMGVMEAVHYAHSRGIIHRDIKPANVIVGPFGEVILTDWGIAKKIRDVPEKEGKAISTIVDAIAAGAEPPTGPSRVIETAAHALVGTPSYMSPEQARGDPVDERSDIYSLCVLFHELLCLRHYLSECKNLNAVLHGARETDAQHPSFVPCDKQSPVPADLGWFAIRGLRKNPAERYQSVDEMIERLKKRSEGLVPVQCAITFVKRSTGGMNRFVDRHPKLTVAGVYLGGLSLLTLLGLTGFMIVRALL